MDLTQLRTKMTASQTEQPADRPTSPPSSDGGSGGSWRRKSLLAVAMLGLGLYLRRRRSGTADTTTSDGGADATQTVDHENPDADQSSGRSLGRRLVMMALSTLAVTLARRVFRRFRRAR